MTGSSSVSEFKSVPPLFPPKDRPTGDPHRLSEFFSVHWNVIGKELSDCCLIRHSPYENGHNLFRPVTGGKKIGAAILSTGNFRGFRAVMTLL
jgi:hypothetical protein